MATAQFAQRGPLPNAFKSDLDMESLFDFNQGTQGTFTPIHENGPAQASSSKQVAQSFKEESEQFAGPSHEYDRFPQQTGVGVSVGDMQSLASLNQPMHGMSSFSGYNSGIDDGFGWDMDSDMNMDMAGMSFSGTMNPTFIDIPEEPQQNIRFWPGMHQQAALAKQQQQQQQQQLQQLQQQGQPQQDVKGKGKANAHSDHHTEESISRLLSQMRQNSASIDDDSISQNGTVSGGLRSKKDEEDMDDDERLLASDEGKKLSSKERRQLRNKVSARAFRSRRKEYIGQLEGEVAIKAQEVSTLQADKNALSEENARYRALIQTLLRHPSFTPFIEDISKDPAFIAAQQQTARRASANAAAQQQQQQQQVPRSSELPSIAEESPVPNLNRSFTPNPSQAVAFDFSQPQFYPQQQPSVPLNLNPSQQSYF